jgi:hypothetical protein
MAVCEHECGCAQVAAVAVPVSKKVARCEGNTCVSTGALRTLSSAQHRHRHRHRHRHAGAKSAPSWFGRLASAHARDKRGGAWQTIRGGAIGFGRYTRRPPVNGDADAWLWSPWRRLVF